MSPSVVGVRPGMAIGVGLGIGAGSEDVGGVGCTVGCNSASLGTMTGAGVSKAALAPL